MNRIFTLLITLFTLNLAQAQISTIDSCTMYNSSTGVATFKGKAAKIKGIVTTPNFRITPTKGLTFNITDGTNGISIFNAKDTLGYFVQKGDSVEVTGKVDQFNGLQQIAATAINLIGSGYKIPSPTISTSMDESNEGDLITIKGLFAKSTSTWGTGTSGFNIKFYNAAGDSFDIRVDNDVDLFKASAPSTSDTFDITGVVGQFIAKSPFLSGYQLQVRSSADMVKAASTTTSSPSAGCTIADARKNDVNGHPVNAGSKCQYKGIVHSENFAASSKGLQFDLIDATGAVTVYINKKNFGYTPNRGDSVYVSGIDSFYNGLTEIYPDTVVLLNSGNKLFAPKLMTVQSDLNESTESYLVKVDSVVIINPTAWTGTGSGFNVLAKKISSNDTFTIRIDNDVDLFKLSVPKDTFSVVGVVSQFDSKSPYFSGYQIMPRDTNDLVHLKIASTSASGEIQWSKKIHNVAENIDSYKVVINVTKTLTSAGSIDVILNANGTNTVNGTDFKWTNKTITIPSGTKTKTVSFYVKIIDNFVVNNGLRYFTLQFSNPVGVTTLDTFTTINIIDNDVPKIINIVKIRDARSYNKTTGVPDSNTKFVFLKGIVNSDNFSAKGLDFSLQDSTGGVKIFATKPINGYGVKRGDSLFVGGHITQFNGLTEITVDTISLLNSNNTTVSPLVIKSLDETLEGKIVQVKMVKMINSAQWVASAGKSFNFKVVDMSNDTTDVRVNANTNLIKRTSALVGYWNISGEAGQFDASAPYFSGYQLLCRDSADIQFVSLLGIEEQITNHIAIKLYPNPSSQMLNISSNINFNGLQVVDLQGRIVYNQAIGNLSSSTQINIGELNAGIYFVKISNNQGVISTQRFIKN